MTHSLLKTFSLSLVTLVGATLASAQQNGVAHFVSTNADAAPKACAAPADIERGWEQQIELIEARVAAKAQDTANLAGAVVTPPFQKFAPYRTDVPVTRSARKNKATVRTSTEGDQH